MAAFLNGPKTWSASVDEDGHRTYKVLWKLRTELFGEGPATVMDCPDLPVPGDIWDLDSDLDPWAWCRRTMVVSPVIEGEPNLDWTVEQTFSTKPLGHCQDDIIDDPLNYPDKISGSFRTLSEEAYTDRFFRRIMNSAHEQLRGPKVEFDRGFPGVRVEQNRRDVEFDLLSELIHTVNDDVLWGFPARCVKLSRISWECLYTAHCEPYVKRVLEFDIDPKTWDRDVWDEATAVLRGRWSADGGEWIIATINGKPADPNNPKHFQQFKDPLSEPKSVILNGFGLPADSSVATTEVFVSRKNGNIGNELDNSEWWIPLLDTSAPVEWDADTYYPIGDRATFAGSHWLAIADAGIGDFPPDVSDLWTVLPLFSNAGSYNPAFTYAKGEYSNKLIRTQAGKRHIEFYPESNFLLLGIPTELICSTDR